MLDPLSSLNLASTVVQFIDFGWKLAAEGCELYRSGSLGRNDELEQITKDIAQFAENLIAANKCSDLGLSNDEKALRQLASSCKVLADKLLSELSTLKLQKPQNGLESFRTALRSSRKRGSVQGIEKRLEDLQRQLNVRLMNILRYSNSLSIGEI
jgi:hypothetical protein